jgi:hypothetical protein
MQKRSPDGRSAADQRVIQRINQLGRFKEKSRHRHFV